jgi:hypothetical protein
MSENKSRLTVLPSQSFREKLENLCFLVEKSGQQGEREYLVGTNLFTDERVKVCYNKFAFEKNNIQASIYDLMDKYSNNKIFIFLNCIKNANGNFESTRLGIPADLVLTGTINVTKRYETEYSTIGQAVSIVYPEKSIKVKKQINPYLIKMLSKPVKGGKKTLFVRGFNLETNELFGFQVSQFYDLKYQKIASGEGSLDNFLNKNDVKVYGVGSIEAGYQLIDYINENILTNKNFILEIFEKDSYNFPYKNVEQVTSTSFDFSKPFIIDNNKTGYLEGVLVFQKTKKGHLVLNSVYPFKYSKNPESIINLPSQNIELSGKLKQKLNMETNTGKKENISITEAIENLDGIELDELPVAPSF